jgi:RNA polymerase primary sigma factor
MYLRDVIRQPPLRAFEEKRLARTLRLSRARIHASSVPSRTVLRRYESARTRLIERNLRLVIAVAKRYAHLGMDLADLVQEGNIGLIQAVERFDPERGVRFATYAVWWIRQAIRRALSSKSRIVRVPINRGQLARKAIRLGEELEGRMGRKPRPSELASELGVAERRLESALSAVSKVESFDALSIDEGSQRWQLEADSRVSSPWRSVLQAERRETVGALMETLSPREQLVVRSRFAIGLPGPATLEEVGAVLHITRERVRQLEKAALGRLAHEAERLGLGSLVGG